MWSSWPRARMSGRIFFQAQAADHAPCASTNVATCHPPFSGRRVAALSERPPFTPRSRQVKGIIEKLGAEEAMKDARRPMDAVTALPALRYVTVIAQDPSVRVDGPEGPILMAKIAIPAEDLIPGPIGYRVQVVDYDSTTRRFNGAHDLPESLAAEPPAWAKGEAKILERLPLPCAERLRPRHEDAGALRVRAGAARRWSLPNATSSRSRRTA